MKPVLLSIIIHLLAATNSYAQPQPDPQAEAFYNKAMPVINKKHVAWIKQTAKTVNEKKWEEAAIRQQAQQYAKGSSLGQMDIEALVLLVMMEASKSAQEDLKAIMAKVKSINNNKETLRNAVNRLQDKRQPALTRLQLDSMKQLTANSNAGRSQTAKTMQTSKISGLDSTKVKRTAVMTQPATKTEIDATADKLKNDLDSMSEMGETESLRLQMAMDRMSKMMSALSNLMKKISDTANQITQNLK